MLSVFLNWWVELRRTKATGKKEEQLELMWHCLMKFNIPCMGIVGALLVFSLFLRKDLVRIHMKEQKTKKNEASKLWNGPQELSGLHTSHRSDPGSTISHDTLCLERQPFGSRGWGIAKG